MIVHIPHSSTYTAGREFIADIRCELGRMTDIYADEIFAWPGNIVFPVSRLVCDVERFLPDEMEEIGMGICYERTSEGLPLRQANDKDMIIDYYYRPYHAMFEGFVTAEIKRQGKCRIVDCHSFPAEPLPYERDASRPDICIGLNDFGAETAMLGEAAADHLRARGYECMINAPFWGAIVPMRYWKDERVTSIMIEVNRGLYASGFNKTNGFAEVRDDMQELLQLIAEA